MAPPSAELSGDALRQRSSPLVRRIAKEQNVDISQIQGTGISGRVAHDQHTTETRWTGQQNFHTGSGSRVTISAPSDNILMLAQVEDATVVGQLSVAAPGSVAPVFTPILTMTPGVTTWKTTAPPFPAC